MASRQFPSNVRYEVMLVSILALNSVNKCRHEQNDESCVNTTFSGGKNASAVAYFYGTMHKMKRISIYVPEQGVMETISPAYRTFTSANDFLQSCGRDPLFEVEFVGLQKQVRVQNGEYILPVHRLIGDVSDTDLLIIPALYGNIGEALEKNRQAIPWIKEMRESGAEVASLCIGVFLLAQTGILNGKRCSTHWAYYKELSEMFPGLEIVSGSIITDEGGVYSSGGANSIWNLLLYILEKYTHRDVVILASKFFAIDIDRDSQNVFTIFNGQKDHNDKEVLDAQRFLEKNFSEKITIDELADRVNINRRSFERRFKKVTNNTIVEYIQRIRMEAAKRNFEATRKNVNEVMYEVGYSDTKAFRDVFKRITGLTPIEYRNKYNKAVPG